VGCPPYSTGFFDDSSEEDDDFLPSLRILRFRLIHGRLPIPPATANTLHTLCFVNCSGLHETQFLDVIRRHSESLRRLCVSRVRFPTGTLIRRLITALSHLQSLESLVINTNGGWLAEPILPHLPPSLIELSIASDLEPFSFTAFQTFLQTKRKNPTIEVIIKNPNFSPRIDKRWRSFPRRPDAWVLFPRNSERVSIPA
jgi:hypothetical protein